MRILCYNGTDREIVLDNIVVVVIVIIDAIAVVMVGVAGGVRDGFWSPD